MITATYRSEPCSKKIAEAICAEQSTGSWTKSILEDSVKKYRAETLDVNAKEKIMKLGWPIDNLKGQGIPMLLSTIAGNLFGMSAVKGIRLIDVGFPDSYIKDFKGPKFGIEGVRKKLKLNGFPILGCIVKPDIGLNPKQFADVCYEASSGGVRFIKDDELLADQKFCPREERLAKVLEALDKAKSETGRKTLYALNITGPSDGLIERVDRCISAGAECLMVNFVTQGMDSIQSLRNIGKAVIHGHRDMHASFTRSEGHGISFHVLAKLCRLMGADQLHTGGLGKMESSDALDNAKFVRSEWHGLKRTFPVASGGVHPAIVPNIVSKLGCDVVINAGAGIMAHQMGIRAGAKGMADAIEASVKGECLKGKSRELDAALSAWGG